MQCLLPTNTPKHSRQTVLVMSRVRVETKRETRKEEKKKRRERIEIDRKPGVWDSLINTCVRQPAQLRRNLLHYLPGYGWIAGLSITLVYPCWGCLKNDCVVLVLVAEMV